MRNFLFGRSKGDSFSLLCQPFLHPPTPVPTSLLSPPPHFFFEPRVGWPSAPNGDGCSCVVSIWPRHIDAPAPTPLKTCVSALTHFLFFFTKVQTSCQRATPCDPFTRPGVSKNYLWMFLAPAFPILLPLIGQVSLVILTLLALPALFPRSHLPIVKVTYSPPHLVFLPVLKWSPPQMGRVPLNVVETP